MILPVIRECHVVGRMYVDRKDGRPAKLKQQLWEVSKIQIEMHLASRRSNAHEYDEAGRHT